ncbi:hypothetical protein Mapa_000016 [Marchantia paleacea]|nr:hypothetical protein Mapa_000016 [Marchantia paleacea]
MVYAALKEERKTHYYGVFKRRNHYSPAAPDYVVAIRGTELTHSTMHDLHKDVQVLLGLLNSAELIHLLFVVVVELIKKHGSSKV